MGSLYRRTFANGTVGGTWWIKYYVDGRAVRESTGTEDRETAENLLKVKEGKAASGEPVLPRVDRIKADQERSPGPDPGASGPRRRDGAAGA